MEHYFTSERLEELKKELDNLKNVKRAEVADRLKKAKELGDLSENSEYIEAREQQRLVETRIIELEDMTKNAVVIQKTGNTNTVAVGSTIEVTKDGQAFKFTITGSDEANPVEGLISNESPMGSAFMGKKLNQEAKVKTPSGEVVYKITKIE